jgi:hypothetical protein
LVKSEDVPTCVEDELVHEYVNAGLPETLDPVNDPVDNPQSLGEEVGFTDNTGKLLTVTKTDCDVPGQLPPVEVGVTL